MIGAGLAGLVAARELVLQGHTVRVLDAADRAGGQLAATEIAGHHVDVGALPFADTDGAVAALLGRLDHAPILVTAQPQRWWLSTPSAVLPLPAAHWWGVPATPLAADSVAITGRRAAWRGMLDALLPGPRGARAATLDELVRIRMGHGIAERLVAPVVEARTGRPSSQLQLSDVAGLRHLMLQQNSLSRAVTSLLLDHVENSELVTVDGGPSRLIDALVVELGRFGVQIELGARVDDVLDEGVVVAGELRHGEVVVAAPLGGDRGASCTIVTLVLDAEVVASGSRNSGVLAERGRVDGVRRVIDISALWPSLAGTAPPRCVLRVEGSARLTVDAAVRVVSEFWSEPGIDAAVIGSHIVPWVSAASPDEHATTQHPECVIAAVGEHVVGPGVARVVRTTIEAVSALAPDEPAARAPDGGPGV